MSTTNGNKTETREVIRATDYHQFKMLPDNRPVNISHVGGIIRSIEKEGSWLQDEPIIVNEDMEVVDGQHRLEAHKRLELPVYYVVVPSIGIDRAHAMNKSRRNWTLLDWAHSYANGGNVNYQRWVKLMEENNYWSPAVVIAVCYEKPLQKSLQRDFRLGELSLTEEQLVIAQMRLNHLDALAEIAPTFVTSTVARYILQIFTHPRYDQERMVKKMAEAGGDTFVPTAYIGNVLAQMERAYNRGFDLSNFVRFQ